MVLQIFYPDAEITTAALETLYRYKDIAKTVVACSPEELLQNKTLAEFFENLLAFCIHPWGASTMFALQQVIEVEDFSVLLQAAEALEGATELGRMP
jgi:hypothetical protein